MSTALRILLLLGASIATLSAQLPTDSKELHNKLLAYEKERRRVAEEEISTKRSSVIEALIAHQERESKWGNHDNAASIKKLIDSLSRQQEIPPNAGFNMTDEELVEWLKGSVWQFENGRSVTLREDGKIDKSWGILHPAWTVKKGVLFLKGDTLEFAEGHTVILPKSGEYKPWGKAKLLPRKVREGSER